MGGVGEVDGRSQSDRESFSCRTGPHLCCATFLRGVIDAVISAQPLAHRPMPQGLASLLWLLDVRGTGACPAPAMVEQRLRAFNPPAAVADAGPPSDVTDEARLEERPDGTLVVTLLGGRAVRARKTFPPSGDCGERAEMTAVALAIWQERLRSGVSLDVEGLTPAQPTPSPPASPSAAAGAHAPTSADLSALSAPPIAPQRRPSIESVGAGVLGLARGPTAGARIDVRGVGAGDWWRPRLSVTAFGPERLAFAPGEASWIRVFGVAGAELLLWRRPVPRHGNRAAWAVAAGAGAVLGWLHVSGRGFPDNRASTNLDAGVEVGLRLEAGLAPWRPWLGASVLAWVRSQDVVLSGGTESRSLPSWDVAIALGVDFMPNW